MRRFDHVADLPLTVESVSFERRERDTSSDFRRVTTTVELHGPEATGRGEDVTYDAEDHEALAAGGFAPDLTGEYTVASFSRALDDAALFSEPPQRESSHHYRRWAFESAALDLALRRAGRSLGEALGDDYRPVEFVVSTRLESFDRVEALLSVAPDATFKLDPTPSWSDELVASLAETGRVRVLDLKGQYRGTDVDGSIDPEFYRRLAEAFPDAVLEDPAVTDATRPVLESVRDRLSWDAPITGVADVEARPFEPRWVNVKPSRFGTVESLLDTVDYCEREGIRMYGGGQFELGIGRAQIQALASLWYHAAPNDVAPGGYNDPEPTADLPQSPLAPPEDPVGLSF